MVTYNRIIMDLCAVCGVEVGNARISERRARELITECTEKVKVLTMGTAALATVLENELDEDEKEAVEKVAKALEKEKAAEEPAKPRLKAPRKAN